MLIHLIYREGHSFLLWLLLGMQYVIAMKHAGTDMLSSIDHSTGRDFRPVTVMTVTSLCFVLVLISTLTRANRFSWAWMAFAGGLTYPLYLLHENWGRLIISVTHEQIGQLPAVALAAFLCLLAAAAVHLFVERPLAPRLRRVIRQGLEGPPKPRPRAGEAAQSGVGDPSPAQVHRGDGEPIDHSGEPVVLPHPLIG